MLVGDRVFIAKGSGYAEDRSFDNFEVLAEPLPNRDDRVFGRQENGDGGVTYASHSIKLARYKGDRDKDFGRFRDLYILMSHGGGTEVLRIPGFCDRGAYQAALLAMPEPLLYAALYTLYSVARVAREAAEADTSERYARAFVEGRIKKGRADKYGRRAVRIEEPAQEQKAA